MRGAGIGHRLHHAFRIHQLRGCLACIQRLAGCRIGRDIKTLPRPHRTVSIGLQIETAAEVGSACVAALVDQVTQMQLRIRARGIEMNTVLARCIIHHHLVVAAALIFLRLVARQQSIGMPVRLRRTVIDAACDERPVAIAVYPVDQHLFADSRDMHATVSATRIGHRDSHPAGCIFVAVLSRSQWKRTLMRFSSNRCRPLR
jgi:hypothetical protein